MRVVILEDCEGDPIVHRAGCRDIARKLGQDSHAYVNYETSGDTLVEIAENHWSDFIHANERDMTLQDALDNMDFFPCVTLPRGEV